MVLATKLYIPLTEGPNTGGLSALHIRKACEDSLRRLQTDHIDLYQFHHIDRTTPWEEIWEATERLVRDGKVIYVGSSNFAGWDLAAAQEAAKARHFLGLASEQSHLQPDGAHHRAGGAARRPPLRHRAAAVEPARRRAARRRRRQGRRPPRRRQRHPRPQRPGAADRRQPRPGCRPYEDLAAELDVTPTALALAWLLSRPGVTAPVLGPRTLDQLTGSFPALDVTLEPQTLARLDKLFPGPGEAPDAYTW